jgi:hypothetical protein
VKINLKICTVFLWVLALTGLVFLFFQESYILRDGVVFPVGDKQTPLLLKGKIYYLTNLQYVFYEICKYSFFLSWLVQLILYAYSRRKK